MERRTPQHLAVLLLAFAIVCVYGQVVRHDFVRFDDNRYVTDNYRVLEGISWEGVVWAFTTTHASNWHPLTWLSHMADVQLFGPDPGGHHVTNVVLHVLSTMLLFLALLRLTGGFWQSGFVAALFGLHPLHVESVAWIAERKDVLSTAFGMLTLWLYARYTKRPGALRYSLVLVTFALGLMCKPMLVTLPALFLLLDYWPLGRLGLGKPWARVLLEKIPFFVLSVASSGMSLYAHRVAGTLPTFELFPIEVRIANAFTSYLGYVGKVLWPSSLAVYYPHPGSIVMWKTLGAALILGVVTASVIGVVRRRPYLAVGWFWYLGTLVPVIGLVQVGGQAMADRYTYLPTIGLFIAGAWGVVDLTARRRGMTHGLAGASGIVLAVLMTLTWFQVSRWKDTVTLFEHTVRVTAGNDLAHVVLGNQFSGRGDFARATQHFEAAIEIEPKNATAWNNLGTANRKQGKLDVAARYFRAAIKADPSYAKAHYNLGGVMQRQGQLDLAIERYRRAVVLDPNLEDAHTNLAVSLMTLKKPDEALIHFREVLRINPRSANGHYNLGHALLMARRIGEAIPYLEEAVRLNPDHPLAVTRLEQARRKLRR